MTSLSKATPVSPIRQFPLDERTVYVIPIAHNQVTTIQFPSAVTALEGSGITNDPQTTAPVLIHYQPGRWFFSVRALTEKATAGLNVVWNKKTYVLQFTTEGDPLNSVSFYQAINRSFGGPRTEVGPSNLLSLLDLAKVYPVLSAQNAAQLPQMQSAQPHQRMLYRNFELEITDVYRFETADTLVFRLIFYNQSEKEIYYQPQALAVRVGNRVFPCALADASGILPPGNRLPDGSIQPSATLAFFAITGSPDGGRNQLSVVNRFNVLVTRQTKPVTLTRAAPSTQTR